MTHEEQAAYRRQCFRATTIGMRPWRVAKALNTLSRGIDWRGSNKKDMREAFATGEHGLDRSTTNDFRAAITRVAADTA